MILDALPFLKTLDRERRFQKFCRQQIDFRLIDAVAVKIKTIETFSPETNLSLKYPAKSFH